MSVLALEAAAQGSELLYLAAGDAGSCAGMGWAASCAADPGTC